MDVWPKLKVFALIGIGLGVLVGGALFTGVLQQPTASLEDHGDWGTVSEDRTEVLTTLQVTNPNPVGITTGGAADVSYNLYFNNVSIATGQKSGIHVPAGNSTVAVSTYIQNEDLPSWWVSYIEKDETIDVRADSSVTVGAGPLTTTTGLPTQRKTVLQNSTPLINALSQAAAAVEGNYTETVGQPPVRDTIGYDIQRGWATWGNVSEDTTTALFHFRVHNPSNAVAVPSVPDGLGASIAMNNITMFEAQDEQLSPRNIDGDSLIGPGETQKIVLAVEMDNDKLDEWFRSHVANGEKTQIQTQLQLVLGVDYQGRDITLRAPEDVTDPSYTCQLQTGMLVDTQRTKTTCGRPSSMPDTGVAGTITDAMENETAQDGIVNGMVNETDKDSIPDNITNQIAEDTIVDGIANETGEKSIVDGVLNETGK